MLSAERPPDRDDRFVRLEWHGPFFVAPGKGLVADDRWAGEDTLSKLLGQPGVYYVLGDHLIYGSRALLYVGQSDHLSRRLAEHTWLAEEWNVEVYVAGVPIDVLNDVERLLIWAHTPACNARGISACGVRDLRVWNVGRCPRLLPDVSARHPWFEPSRAQPE